MTYENMIQWAINEGLDFDGLLSEFGQDFTFLEDEFNRVIKSTSIIRTSSVLIEPEEEESLSERKQEVLNLFSGFENTSISSFQSQPINAILREKVSTSFINFFRGN